MPSESSMASFGLMDSIHCNHGSPKNLNEQEEGDTSCMGLDNDQFSLGDSSHDWSLDEDTSNRCLESPINFRTSSHYPQQQHHDLSQALHVSPTLSILSRKSQNTIRSLLQKSHATLTTVDLSEDYGYHSDSNHDGDDLRQSTRPPVMEVPQVIHWQRKRPYKKRSPQKATVVNKEKAEVVTVSLEDESFRTTRVEDEYGHSFGSVFQEMSDMVYSRKQSPGTIVEKDLNHYDATHSMWWIRNDQQWWRQDGDLDEPGALPPTFHHKRCDTI